MRLNRIPLVWMMCMLVLAALLAACGGSEEVTLPVSSNSGPSPAEATASIEAALNVPPLDTVTPPSVGEGEGGSVSNGVPAAAPADVTGFELIATGLGEAIYSGYACTIAEVGCACETPILQKATFEFENPQTINYSFGGPGYSAEWPLERVGPNQWSYTLNMYSEEGQREGAFFVLLTFADDGYIITQGADLDEGGMVACPDVYFRRLRDE